MGAIQVSGWEGGHGGQLPSLTNTCTHPHPLQQTNAIPPHTPQTPPHDEQCQKCRAEPAPKAQIYPQKQIPEAQTPCGVQCASECAYPRHQIPNPVPVRVCIRTPDFKCQIKCQAPT